MSTEASDIQSENEKGSFWKYIGIGIAAAISSVLIKIFQSTGEESAIVNTIVHTLIVLIPTAITYYFLSKDQEKKLSLVIGNISTMSSELQDLRRVSDIEKYYFANERMLNIERRVIEETGSSMQEVAELVSAFDDGNPLQIRLKERFRLHAKSIQTFHRAFAVEIEDNLSSISQIEDEFELLEHDVRDQRNYEKSRERTNQVYQRHNLDKIVTNVTRFTQQSAELGNLADKKVQEIEDQLNSSEIKGDK